MNIESLPFAAPTLSDASMVRQIVASARAQQSDLSFANIYLLRRKYGTEIAHRGGFLFRHFSGHGRLQGYAFPCGTGDPRPALRELEQDAASRQRVLRFCLLTEEQKCLLETVYPGRFHFHTDPGDADYIYERRKLEELPGARFHRKRNHLARFQREFAPWNIELLIPGNAHEALQVASAWLSRAQEEKPDEELALKHEYEAISHALHEMQALSLTGVLLYVRDIPVAMSIASHLSPEMADVHYEKCLPDFRLAYPVINQGMAARLTCAFINREEDLNHMGLRQAKVSYFPFKILTKYSAVVC